METLEHGADLEQRTIDGPRGMPWQRLLTLTTWLIAASALWKFALAKPIVFLVIAALFAGGGLRLRRAERRGGSARRVVVYLGVLHVLLGLIVVPAMLRLVDEPTTTSDFVLAFVAGPSCLVGAAAAAVTFRGRVTSAARLPRALAALLVVVTLATMTVAGTARLRLTSATAEPGDVQVTSTYDGFVPTTLDAAAGDLRVFVDNPSAEHHTFTIDELDVDLEVPASSQQAVTFAAPAGTYTYVCRPHADFMTGVLEVR